jgi:inner membrane protein
MISLDWAWAWIIAGVVLAGLEILLPGVYLLWIGLGAIAVGMVLAVVPDLPFAWQALLFTVMMLAAVGLGVFVERRGRRSETELTLNREMEAMIGRTYVASSAFAAGRGRIAVQDTSCAAVSDAAIDAGDLVVVTGIEDGRPRVAPAAEAR